MSGSSPTTPPDRQQPRQSVATVRDEDVASNSASGDSPVAYATGLIRRLASEVGPRRPGSSAERQAAELVASELRDAGLEPQVESFNGPASFALAQAVPPLLSLLGLRKAALSLGLFEGDMRFEPLSRLASRTPSQNVIAEIPAAGEERRTLVLVSHLDSSRSGLLFHPTLAPRLRLLTGVIAAALAARAVRLFDRSAGLVLAAGLALIAEREFKGRDVPGANDNASGVAAALALAREFAESPLGTTRVVFLATGCEESGTVGMRSFLEARRGDWTDWLFLNLDGVGAPATLRYLPREGMLRIFRADPALVGICAQTAGNHPELGLRAATELAGLTYDATQVMARGGRAITLSAQDRTIPNYHSAQDVPENLDGDVLARAISAARLIAEAVDRGEAD